MTRSNSLALALSLLGGCSSSAITDAAIDGFDASLADSPARADAPPLPGDPVPGAVVPAGWTLRRYAPVGEPRSLAFAPNGDLFVSAPSMPTPGGATGGPGAIVVLSDDNHDGVAELTTFADRIADVHGLVIAGDAIYWTTTTQVVRAALATGQRTLSGTPETVATFPAASNGRWTHGLAISGRGDVYASVGIYGGATCGGTAATGGILQIAAGSMTATSTGLFNPMYVRCDPTGALCLAADLGDDTGGTARERLVTVRDGMAYGFPCCNGPSAPSNGNSRGVSCAAVPEEAASFPLGTTPFGFDWDRGLWDAPYRGSFVIAFHGAFSSSPPWLGARIAIAATDPSTHAPSGAFTDLVTGFGPTATLKRPSDVAFGPDGRVFFADDIGNAVYWLAPPGWALPGH